MVVVVVIMMMKEIMVKLHKKLPGQIWETWNRSYASLLENVNLQGSDISMQL